MKLILRLITRTDLTCLGPQYTGVAPVHPLHCVVPPTSHQRLGGTEAERHLS